MGELNDSGASQSSAFSDTTPAPGRSDPHSLQPEFLPVGSLRRPAAERLAVNALWLVRLRWVAVIGQLVTIATAALWLQVDLPLVALVSVVAVTGISNLGFAWWLRRCRYSWSGEAAARRGRILLGAAMFADLLALTALLYFAGGPSNPFAVFYFVNLALAAVILPVRWAWALTFVAVVCFSTLFLDHVHLPHLEPNIDPATRPPDNWLRLQEVGLLVAMAACASVVTYFITRVTGELQKRETQLRAIEKQRADSQRLEALATLAAGAGHELASPLSTIAVVAKELTQQLEGTDVPEAVREDVALIRSELDHCRAILDRMSGHAGQAVGEQVSPVTLRTLVDEVIHGVRPGAKVRVEFVGEAAETQIAVPLQGLAQAVRGVVQNALDATPDGGEVRLLTRSESDRIVLAVQDQGEGMPEEIRQRVGEPFFTTKEPGKGMGLGMFLTRNVIERLGGIMEIHSEWQEGTTVEIMLPRSPTTSEPNR